MNGLFGIVQTVSWAMLSLSVFLTVLASDTYQDLLKDNPTDSVVNNEHQSLSHSDPLMFLSHLVDGDSVHVNNFAEFNVNAFAESLAEAPERVIYSGVSNQTPAQKRILVSFYQYDCCSKRHNKRLPVNVVVDAEPTRLLNLEGKKNWLLDVISRLLDSNGNTFCFDLDNGCLPPKR